MKFKSFLPLLTLLLVCVGCVQIQTAAIKGPLTRVADSHDKYVAADKSLTPGAAAVYTADTTFLRSELTKTQVPASEIATQLNAVADREDAYVNADITLPIYKKSADLRDTALLREVLKAGTSATQPTQ